MICCDTNILIYAFDISSPYHTASKRFIQNESQSSKKLAIPTQVLLEFYRVSTQKIPKPVSPEKAQRAIRDLTSNSNITIITPLPATYATAMARAVKDRVSGAAIFDYHLAATLLDHSIDTIATKNTKHFAKFPELTVIDPTQ
jgi:toxin-antitoxin system PIN domain toxin